MGNLTPSDLPLLTMLHLHEQALDQFAGGRTNRSSPSDEFARRPFGVRPMRSRYVL